MALTIRVTHIKSYNCAMATIDHITVRDPDAACKYVDLRAVAPQKMDAAIVEFLKWLRTPDIKVEGTYTERLAFYVFHDNVKFFELGQSSPLQSLKHLFPYLYKNQEKFGIGVWKTDLVDNLWHPPSGHHPGRVWVLSPPYVTTFRTGAKLTKEVKFQLKGISDQLEPDDQKVIQELIATA